MKFCQHTEVRPYSSLIVFFSCVSCVSCVSCWALIPAGISTIGIVVRTALEDTALQQELDGYQEYARQVHYRLVPGWW